MRASWPKAGATDDALLDKFEAVKELISAIRTVRLQKNIPSKEQIELNIVSDGHNHEYDCVVIKMCNINAINKVEKKDPAAISFLVRTAEYEIPLADKINIEEEIRKTKAEIERFEGFLKGVMAKLGNERFIQNAKADIVERERKKKSDAESKLASLREKLRSLGV